MHSEDGEEDLHATSARYGVVPTIVGVVLAGGLIWFMFELADGFH